MGKLFLIFLGNIFLLSETYAETPIIIIPEPRRVKPPKAVLPKPKARPSKQPPKLKLQDVLKEETWKERPYKLRLNISLVIPFVKVAAPRRDFSVDPNSHFSVLFDAGNFWWGGYIASFSGVGTYNQTVGSYGFAYSGLCIGLGSRTEVLPESVKSNQRKGAMTTAQQQGRKYARKFKYSAVLLGLSVMARKTQVAPTSPDALKDLNTVRSVKAEGGALWLEVHWGWLNWGGLGYHYLAGLQRGEGKNFVWLGLGLSAWY